jgi:XRE family aerobic/anaerobic benzoate catabolism transcriptional regulator
VPFFELDGEVEREAGLAIGAIIELHGQPAFRRLERRALERLVAEPQAVIAAGGGIVADPGTFDLLLSYCRTVWVRASPEEHMQRVIDQGDLRPMQDDNRQAMRDLRAILASREALYARADLALDTSGKLPGESFMQLMDLIRLESPTLGTDNPSG